MKTLAEKLVELRTNKGVSQSEVANYLGITRTAYSKYESGASRPVRRLNEIANYYHVSIDYLLGNDNNNNNFNTPKETSLVSNIYKITDDVIIPIVGKIACGKPLLAEENIEGYISVDRKHEACWALRINGDSMKPKLMDGDIAVIQPAADVSSSEMAIVSVGGDEATCKYVKKAGNGIMLVAENSAVYEPTFYSAEEVRDLPIRVIGKVIESRRRY